MSAMLTLPSAVGPLGTDPEPRNQSTVPMYLPGDIVKGSINLQGTGAKPVMHHGIHIELVGEVTIPDHGTSTFTQLRHEYAPTGHIPAQTEAPTRIDFDFGAAQLPYESYHGASVRCQYFIRILVNFGSAKKIGMRQTEIGIVRPAEAVGPAPEKIDIQVNTSMPGDRETVGLELSFKFPKNSFSLHDVIEGELLFHECNLPVTNITAEIRRRETSALGVDAAAGPSTSVVTVDTVLHTAEIADGTPVRGARIPLRIPLATCGRDSEGKHTGVAYLTPTVRGVHKRFDVRWYVVVFIDSPLGKSTKTIEFFLSRLPGQVEASKI